MSDEHTEGQVLVWDKKMIRSHVVDDEFRDVDSNAFQKAIDDKRSRTPSVTILSWFWQEIIEHDLSQDLGGESIVLHLLVPN